MNFQQAPILKHKGVKERNETGWGFARRPHELEAAFAECLGDKEFAMYKIMMFLSGNAPNKFRVTEKTIMDRCNISETGYKKARKKLVEKGWISHEPSKYIQVNFDKIYSDFKIKQQQGYPEESSAPVASPSILKAPDGVPSGLQEDSSEQPVGFPENTYNNISNKISDNRIKIAHNEPCCENTRSAVANATAPQALSQPLRERSYAWYDIKEAERKYKKWEHDYYERMMCFLDDDDYEGIAAMKETDEYKEFLRQCEEKRQELKAKFGNLISF